MFDKTRVPLLSKALDAYALRNKVISENIANISTSDYKSKSVKFEDELKGVIKGNVKLAGMTHERHIAIGNGAGSPNSPHRIIENSDNAAIESNGINNVDLDVEMAELAKNQIRFKFVARLLSNAFKGIQKSIKGHA